MQNLVHFFVAGGWVMYPLALLSLATVAVILERLSAYRTIAATEPELTEQIIRLAREGNVGGALDLARGGRGPVSTVLAEILAHASFPVDEIERRVQEVGEPMFVRLEHRLPLLDTGATISPLLGLLGTLFGMIATFRAIGASKSSGANDAILSGVGESLYATATGLTIAIICFVSYNAFAAKSRQVVAETEQAATRLINALPTSQKA